MKELVIYGKAGCSECDMLLVKLNETELTYLTLNVNYSIKDLMEIKPIDVRSFPVSFIKTKDEDGEDLYTYIKNDEIQKEFP